MEESWRKWWRMAQGSLAAAQTLEESGEVRSSASRAYYAAYQALTSVLLYLKQTPPQDREAWSHEATPDLVRRTTASFWRQGKRNDLSSRLGTLYKLRVRADYVGDRGMNSAALSGILKDAGYILASAEAVLKQGPSE